MPWKVRKGAGARPWKIVRSDTGEVVAASKTREKALASVRARFAAASDTEKELWKHAKG